MRDLWFRYADDGPWVLEGVDLHVRPGESVAIVGPSGSGKSTLLRLLLGLETPTRGSISYDDKDLKDLDLRLVRRQIGTVLDSSTLFPGSLYENIAGSSPLSRDQVLDAARLAGLEADIANMPMGLDSAVTDSGGQISGGQRQRVIIARALVNKPRLLFFDEATSALDNRTQATVQRSIERMNATRIIVAHRLSTIRDADRIRRPGGRPHRRDRPLRRPSGQTRRLPPPGSPPVALETRNLTATQREVAWCLESQMPDTDPLSSRAQRGTFPAASKAPRYGKRG